MQSYGEKEERMRVVQRNHVNLPNFKRCASLYLFVLGIRQVWVV
jgi:hypothetical protein